MFALLIGFHGFLERPEIEKESDHIVVNVIFTHEYGSVVKVKNPNHSFALCQNLDIFT